METQAPPRPFQTYCVVVLHVLSIVCILVSELYVLEQRIFSLIKNRTLLLLKPCVKKLSACIDLSVVTMLAKNFLFSFLKDIY